MSDYLNSAARQRPIEQYSSFQQNIKQKFKNSEFCHLSTLSLTYTRNMMCKSNLLGGAATANLEQDEEKLTSHFTSCKVEFFVPVSHPFVHFQTRTRNVIGIKGQIRQKLSS